MATHNWWGQIVWVSRQCFGASSPPQLPRFKPWDSLSETTMDPLGCSTVPRIDHNSKVPRFHKSISHGMWLFTIISSQVNSHGVSQKKKNIMCVCYPDNTSIKDLAKMPRICHIVYHELHWTWETNPSKSTMISLPGQWYSAPGAILPFLWSHRPLGSNFRLHGGAWDLPMGKSYGNIYWEWSWYGNI